MAAIFNEQEFIEKWRKLTPNDQQFVIDLMQRLTQPLGEPGDQLARHAREINFPKEDLAEIAEAIKELDEDIQSREIDLDA